MSVGLPVTKEEVDARAGDISRTFQRVFEDVLTMQSFLAAKTEEDLVELGYTPDEVASLKTAFADLEQLGTIWFGQNSLAEAKDFTVFVSRLWGVGAF